MLNLDLRQQINDTYAKLRWTLFYCYAVSNRLDALGIELTDIGRKNLLDEISTMVSELYDREDDTWKYKMLHFYLVYSSEDFVKEYPQELLDSFSLELDDLKNGYDKLENSFDDIKIKQEIEEDITEKLYQSWKELAVSIIETKQENSSEFRSALNEIWQKPMLLLSTLIGVSAKIFNEHIENLQPFSENEYSHLTDALIRLNARGQQIVGEVFLLLENGYPDGAMARWRSLHEITVISSFLVKHGEETAEKYLDYLFIENYDLMNEYLRHNSNDNISSDEVLFSKKMYNEMIKKHGKGFTRPKGWGWAKHILKSPNLRTVVESLDLDYLRPKYIHGNYEVHASSFSMLVRLGLGMNPNTEQILAGASVYGIDTPATATASTLGHLIGLFLSHKPPPDVNIILNALVLLRNEVLQEFDKIKVDEDN